MEIKNKKENEYFNEFRKCLRLRFLIDYLVSHLK